MMTAQFFDSVTDSGSDRFLVQDRAGSAPALLRLTHLASLGRGLLIAVGLLVLAGPIARLSGAPHLAPEIAVLAIAPLILGLANWDSWRQHRDIAFPAEGRLVLVEAVVSVVATDTPTTLI